MVVELPEPTRSVPALFQKLHRKMKEIKESVGEIGGEFATLSRLEQARIR
jgi:hypothetical protein